MDGPVIADFVGKIALAEGTMLLRNTIHDFLRQANNRIILNLADVDFIDSAGLGELVRTLASVRSHSGQLKLVKPSENVHKLLRITKLDHVFDVENDDASAVCRLARIPPLKRQAKTPEQSAPRVFSLRHVAGCVSFRLAFQPGSRSGIARVAAVSTQEKDPAKNLAVPANAGVKRSAQKAARINTGCTVR
jgi:anti-sigma B factor antagonist